MKTARSTAVLLLFCSLLLCSACAPEQSASVDGGMVIEPDASVDAAIHNVRPPDSIDTPMPALPPDSM